MTVSVDDPLIAGMAITRTLPLHESSRRLRELYPECPRVYGVAVMSRSDPAAVVAAARGAHDGSVAGDVRASARGDGQPGRRRPAACGDAGPCRHRQGDSAARHSKAGHGTPAWRTCGCTSTPRARSTGSASSTRRCGRCPTIRSSTTAQDLGAAHSARDGIVALPSEAALTTWVAHRSHRALRAAVRQALRGQRRRDHRSPSMWHIVGAAVVGAATQVPLLAGSSELTSMRRGQAVLDALVGFGLPVRGGPATRGEGLAKLGQPCLSCLTSAADRPES